VRGERSCHPEGHVVVDFHDDVELVLVHLVDCTIVAKALTGISYTSAINISDWWYTGIVDETVDLPPSLQHTLHQPG
jgi:hypothetical protein